MFKCLFCESKNTSFLSSNDGITKHYKKEVRYGTVHNTEEESLMYPIVKLICLDCGYVFQKNE